MSATSAAGSSCSTARSSPYRPSRISSRTSGSRSCSVGVVVTASSNTLCTHLPSAPRRNCIGFARLHRAGTLAIMRILARYRGPVTASQAAAYLPSEGIGARAWVSDSGYTREVWLLIGENEDRGRAWDLLVEYTKQKPTFEESLEAQALPDLSTLDPALAPPCPACRRALPLDAAITQCSCGAPVDIPELIVQAHGPEVLQSCFAAAPDAVFGELSDEKA